MFTRSLILSAQLEPCTHLEITLSRAIFSTMLDVGPTELSGLKFWDTLMVEMSSQVPGVCLLVWLYGELRCVEPSCLASFLSCLLLVWLPSFLDVWGIECFNLAPLWLVIVCTACLNVCVCMHVSAYYRMERLPVFDRNSQMCMERSQNINSSSRP